MDPSIIAVLVTADRRKIEALYNEHREAFINFGRGYGVTAEIMADIYQEAFLVLRKQAINGNLTQVESSLKTYLFGIGKRLIFNHFKELKRSVTLKPELHIVDDSIEELSFDVAVVLSEEQKLLRKFFDRLGKRCQEMLILFYYRGLTVDEIAETAGYENNNVVSSQKSRCIKQLKELINSP